MNKNIFNSQSNGIDYFLELINQTKVELNNDLHNAKLLFINKVEESLPETYNKPLNKIDFKEIFNKELSEFAGIYNEIIQFYIDLNQDNLQYTFGEKVEYTKEKFLEKLEDIENKLKNL